MKTVQPNGATDLSVREGGSLEPKRHPMNDISKGDPRSLDVIKEDNSHSECFLSNLDEELKEDHSSIALQIIT